MDNENYEKDEYRYRAIRAETWLQQAYDKITSQRIIIIVMIALLVLSILYFNNYQIILRLNGLRETVILHNDVWNSSSSMTRVIYSNRGQGQFARLHRNRFGIWSATDWSWKDTETGMLSTIWTSSEFAVLPDRRFNARILHLAYQNDNATGSLIQIDNSLLPQNVTVSIRQFWGGRYILHFQIRTYDDDEMRRLQELINEDFVNYLIGGFIR